MVEMDPLNACSLPTKMFLMPLPCALTPDKTSDPISDIYRVAQNHGKQVLRISHSILSFLDEIASAYQQLPFFTRSAQLPLLSKVSCSDLFAHEE